MDVITSNNNGAIAQMGKIIKEVLPLKISE